MCICILCLKCIFHNSKWLTFIHTRFIQNSHKCQGSSVCVWSAVDFKYWKKRQYKTTKIIQHLYLHGRVSNTSGLLNNWFLIPLHQQKFCKHKTSVQIMAYIQRALQNYQHQNIETCTKFTNVHFFFFCLKTSTLVPWYKKTPPWLDWKIN